MTPDAALNPINEPNPIKPPSTAGMTTRVVKGSMWTLGGSVLPLAVSFISTPLIIHFLGPEGYGVLLLVGLIPMYFSFADLGMSLAAIKYGSQAYGEGDRVKEAAVVRTASLIALISSLAVAMPLFLFSYTVVGAFNVPETIRAEASIALKLSTVAFVFGILNTVLNAPMYARLRMDLNTLTNAGPKILLAVITPVILYFGGGIIGAVSWALAVVFGAFLTIGYLSGRLLPELFRGGASRDLLKPLLKLGGGWFVAMIAAILLVNLEKLMLTSLVSVEALAYYSIAFTLANMATLFSQAMIQSLLPAFSQLLSPEKRGEFDVLLSRGIRLLLIWLLPALVVMFIAVRPFLTVWVGEQFARESTPPFYILLCGLFFNVMAFIPHAALTAVGRTDVLAKLYWSELALYSIAAFVLIFNFGIIGAAIAWTIRVIVDAFVVIYLSKALAGVKFRFFDHFGALVLAAIFLVPSVAFSLVYDSLSIWVVVTLPAGIAVYAWVVWKRFVQKEERAWIENRVGNLLGFQ